jgi:hypothetical protein
MLNLLMHRVNQKVKSNPREALQVSESTVNWGGGGGDMQGIIQNKKILPFQMKTKKKK